MLDKELNPFHAQFLYYNYYFMWDEIGFEHLYLSFVCLSARMCTFETSEKTFMKPATQHHDTTDLFNLSSLLLSSSSSSKDRKEVFKYYCTPILMYGAESRVRTRADISRPTAPEMRLLRSTEGKNQDIIEKKKSSELTLKGKLIFRMLNFF